MSARFILTAILVVVSLLTTTGCKSSETIQIDAASADDRRIAAEAMKQLKPHLASNREIARRHGKFRSLELSLVLKASESQFNNEYQPPMLLVYCVAHFERFSTNLILQVVEEDTLNIFMDRDEESISTKGSPLSGYKPTQVGNQLWFVHPDDPQDRVQSQIRCRISHPDVKP